jgi:hypothetical protein
MAVMDDQDLEGSVQIMAGWNLVDNMTEYADYLEYKYG